jgi:hypothetical protein
MLTRTFAVLSVGVALTLSGSAAHAGFVRNVGRLAVANAKFDAAVLKQGVTGAARLGKLELQKDRIVARCALRAAGAQPCI